ncbi:MAG: hypothetical protein V4542_18275 [Pseudomonadota bacterium]
MFADLLFRMLCRVFVLKFPNFTPLLVSDEKTDGQRHGNRSQEHKKAYPIEFHQPVRSISVEPTPSSHLLDCDEDHSDDAPNGRDASNPNAYDQQAGRPR